MHQNKPGRQADY